MNEHELAGTVIGGLLGMLFLGSLIPLILVLIALAVLAIFFPRVALGLFIHVIFQSVALAIDPRSIGLYLFAILLSIIAWIMLFRNWRKKKRLAREKENEEMRARQHQRQKEDELIKLKIQNEKMELAIKEASLRKEESKKEPEGKPDSPVIIIPEKQSLDSPRKK